MAPVAAALPVIGKGLAVGATSFGATKALGKLFGNDDEDQKDQEQPQVAPGQVPGAVGQPMAPMGAPNPYQQVYAPPQAGMPGYAVPTAAGMAGAGAAVVTASQPATAENAPQAAVENDGDDSFLKSMGKTLMAAGAGGVGGFLLKNQQAEEQGLEGGDRIKELAKGVLAGAGSGAFAKQGFDAIQEEGGGFKAGVNTGIAGALSSVLKDGGPGLGASFATAFGAGSVSNLAHDKLEEKGNGKLADALAGAGLGGGLGYSALGDGKMAGLLGLGGAGLSTAAGELDRQGGLGAMFSKEDSPLKALEQLTGGSAPEKDNDSPQLG